MSNMKVLLNMSNKMLDPCEKRIIVNHIEKSGGFMSNQDLH